MRGLMTPLARDCEVTMIPSGERVTVPAGTEVRVLQTLGGNVTETKPECSNCSTSFK